VGGWAYRVVDWMTKGAPRPNLVGDGRTSARPDGMLRSRHEWEHAGRDRQGDTNSETGLRQPLFFTQHRKKQGRKQGKLPRPRSLP